MTSGEAATQLCTCVFDCNVPLLRRYMKAGILVNAGNFDSRTALHVAAAEGNLAAVRPAACFPRRLDAAHTLSVHERPQPNTGTCMPHNLFSSGTISTRTTLCN